MRFLTCFILASLSSAAFAQQARIVSLPSQSPLVSLRIVLLTGAAYDPPDKPGLANLTAAMLSEGGSKELTYKEILDAMFPMATSVSSQVDKEMTTFSGDTHVDNLQGYYKLLRAMLLEPGWREDDFKRVKDDAINYLRVTLRGNNDEELGKEALYNAIYAGTPYGHENVGTVSSLEKLTLADLKQFYRDHYTQANLIVGIAGGYPPEFLARVKRDFTRLPKGSVSAAGLSPAVMPITHTRATLIDKDTRSVAYSIGFPLDVRRGDPDYPALLVAQSYFGQHRESGGELYQRMRELRGLNYGDYAYIEYFPRGMFRFEPDPNLGRQSEIFQIWIRPLEPPTAVFGLRLALFELDKLIQNGLSPEAFERTRGFLSKYVNLLTKTQSAQLGYAIDSAYYHIPDYNTYIKERLAKLTVADVNRAIRKHLRTDKLQIVAVTRNAADLAAKLTGGAPSPITYNSPKPEEITKEDSIVEKWNIGLRPEDITIAPVDKVFE